jgi:hypothetical protein
VIEAALRSSQPDPEAGMEADPGALRARRLVFTAASRMSTHERFYEIKDISSRGIQFRFEQALREHTLRLGRSKRVGSFEELDEEIEQSLANLYDEDMLMKSEEILEQKQRPLNMLRTIGFRVEDDGTASSSSQLLDSSHV